MNSVERLYDMINQAMVDNVENCWIHLRKSMDVMRATEKMHQTMLRNHEPEFGTFGTTTQMSHDLLCQARNVLREAEDDMGWALESLLNGCLSYVDEEV
jgi:hypothetical protein